MFHSNIAADRRTDIQTERQRDEKATNNPGDNRTVVVGGGNS